MKPNRYYVRLIGTNETLAALEPFLLRRGCEVERGQNEEWYFYHPTFKAATTDAAEFILREVLGAVRSNMPIGPVDVQETMHVDESGRRTVHLIAEVNVMVNVSSSLSINNGDYAREEPRDSVLEAVEVLGKDENLARAARILSEESDDWNSLHKVFEALEATGIPLKELRPKSELERFTHTANSLAALGDAARHGKGKIPAPAHPMALGEAKSLVKALFLQVAQRLRQGA